MQLVINVSRNQVEYEFALVHFISVGFEFESIAWALHVLATNKVVGKGIFAFAKSENMAKSGRTASRTGGWKG